MKPSIKILELLAVLQRAAHQRQIIHDKHKAIEAYEQHVQVLVDLLLYYGRLDQEDAARALGRLTVELVMDIQENQSGSWTKEQTRW